MRSLGSLFAGAGYAVKAGVDTYRTLESARREQAQEQRNKEEHTQRQKEWDRRNKVEDPRSQQQLEDLQAENEARTAARAAYAPPDETTPARAPLSSAPAPAPTGPDSGVTVTPLADVPQPEQVSTDGAPVVRPMSMAQAAPAPDASAAPEPRALSTLASGVPDAAPAPQAPQAPQAPAIADGGAPAQRPSFTPAYRQAAARANAYRQAGQPDKGQKVMTDYYNGAISEEEARHKFDLMPRMAKLRDSKLTTEELQNDSSYQSLQRDMQASASKAAGQMWGLLKLGDMDGAVRMFNASGLVMPDQQADHFQEVDDGKGNKFVVPMGKDNKPLMGRDGRQVAVPVAALEREWTIANTTNSNVPARDRVVQTTRNEKGQLETREVIRSEDPAGERRAATEGRVATTAENTRKDRLHREARAAVKDQLFAGMGMMDKVDDTKQKIHARAAEIAEGYADNGMAPGAAATRAIRETEDAMKREAKGALPRAGATPSGGRTVADIIGH